MQNNDFYAGAVGSYDSAGNVVAYIDQDESVSTNVKYFLQEASLEKLFAPETITQLTQSYLGTELWGRVFCINFQYLIIGYLVIRVRTYFVSKTRWILFVKIPFTEFHC